MPISDYATYQSKVDVPRQRIFDTKVTATIRQGAFASVWTIAPDAGAAPSTAVVPTRATAGALGQFNSTGTQRLIQAVMSAALGSAIIIADRLSHQGGLSGTVATAQTTNLPTAALTRYTSGVGVFAAVEIYTAIGTAAATFTVSYTNQAGTSGRTSIATSIGQANYNTALRVLLIPLQSGDTGVRSVESLTLSGSTGTAGNFGITLFKPLFVMPVVDVGSLQLLFDGLQMGLMPIIENDACLFFLASGATSNLGVLMQSLRIAEE